MFNGTPYKEDNESFPEPLILCPGHVPSQAEGQNGQLRIYGLSVTLVFICYFAQAIWWPRFELIKNLFVRECVKAEFPMVATHPTVANTSERQLLHPDNSDWKIVWN